MRKRSGILGGVLFVSALLQAQTTTAFHRGYSTHAASAFSCWGGIRPGPDASYYLSWVKRDPVLFFSDTVMVMRTDSLGETLWAEKIYLADSVGLRTNYVNLANGPDNGLMVSLPYLTDNGYGHVAMSLAPSGNLQWSIARSEYCFPTGFCTVEDTTYFIGYVKLTAQDPGQGFIAKYTSSGQSVWTSMHVAMTTGSLTRIADAGDGTLIVAGHTGDTLLYGTTLAKVTHGGDLVWSYAYPTGSEFAITDLKVTSTGDLLLAGTYVMQGLQTEMALLKFSGDGAPLWGRTFGGPDFDEGRTVHERATGGYVLCGEPESFGLGSQAAMIALNEDGAFEWMRVYGDTTVGYHPFGAVLNQDGGYTLFGIYGSYWNIADIYLLRTDLNGYSCHEQFDTIPTMSQILLTDSASGELIPVPAFGPSPLEVMVEPVVSYLNCMEYAPASEVEEGLFIPNVFTPNEDGLNGEFLIRYTGTAEFRLVFITDGEVESSIQKVRVFPGMGPLMACPCRVVYTTMCVRLVLTASVAPLHFCVRTDPPFEEAWHPQQHLPLSGDHAQ